MDFSLLDFRPGLAFVESRWDALEASVCPARPCLRSPFWLVVSFGRCIFKLNSVSVGHLLQAALGGLAEDFEVLQLADRVFRFSVSSMAVGFHIYNLGSIERKEFKAFFNLWNRGGPNWKHEFRLFLDEEAASWSMVQVRNSSSYADVVKLPLTGANAVPIRNLARSPGGAQHAARAGSSVFNRLGRPSTNRAQALNGWRPQALPRPRPRVSVFDRLHPQASGPWLSASNGRTGLPRFLDPIRSGVAIGGRPSNRSKFQNLNSGRSRPCNLQWRPVRARGPAGLPGSVTLCCHFCKGRGHVDFFCPSKFTSFGSPLTSFPAFGSRALLVGNQNSPDRSSWFRTPDVSLSGGPPIFSCFEEFAREVLKKSESAPPQSLTLSLGVTSTKPQLAPSSSAGCRSSLPAQMAFRRVDPEPFLPPGFSASMVLHREIMARSVSRRLPPLHEDWAIISIQPLPDHEITFPAVRDVVREYLVEHRRLGVRDIQRSHLGQVLVQFSSILERDNLVLLGPQQYLDASFTVQRHNDAWNHRALYFNRECWLMLLGFPLDYRSSEHLQVAIGSFGRLILWEEDRRNIYRTLLRVRVTSLEEVPQFIVFSDADGFLGDSWTVQCEIIQQTLLGGQPQDEDPVPAAPADGQQLPFEFFGLGQPVPAAG
jgi:hypothetical protein